METYSTFYSTKTVLPLNLEIIKSASLAMYCDYVVENLHDAEHLTWLTVNHVNEIIDQMHETPVQDFMRYVVELTLRFQQ